MFRIQSIEITGFWKTGIAKADFRNDVNIIIGKNGSGKTTFMNIVHAVLAVDGEVLFDNPFHTITLTLRNGGKTRTVRAKRIDDESFPLPMIQYNISGKRFLAPLIGSDDVRVGSLGMRRRASEDIQRIKQELSALVSVASLSVYRIGGDPDPDMRERMVKRLVSPVDQRLLSLTQRLTQYQLELSNEARDVSVKLQQDVLTSLLYTDSKDGNHIGDLNFDESIERRNLESAYKQLGVSGADIRKKIQDHISAVGVTVRQISELATSRESESTLNIDLSALEAFRLTRKVVEKSLAAETEIKNIFSQRDLFLETLKNFIEDKSFRFVNGELVVETEGKLPLAKLSSGEKQLLILFIEALLQRRKPYIFLADEPELSLHISWQRDIIKAICSLNPNAQIVVATHSPEIAGKFGDCILNMEKILHG